MAEDGRIHTTFNQLIAATGRLSSTDPNLQNIPVRTEAGRRIREGFVVGPGFSELMTADYSQIEMRIMAHLSEDAALIEAFRSGHDFHSVTAARVFGVDPTEVTGEMRAKIKAMNYGLAYGLSAFGLSQQLRIDTSEARGLMDEYFETFGGVRDYLAGIVDEARRSGFTETILGRRRYLPDLTSDNRQRREMAERMALNAPIQGSAADIIKVAMLHVDEALRDQQLASRMLLQVHDELVFEVAEGEHEPLEALVRAADGLSRGADRPPRRLRGHRRQLARRCSLTAGLRRAHRDQDQAEHAVDGGHQQHHLLDRLHHQRRTHAEQDQRSPDEPGGTAPLTRELGEQQQLHHRQGSADAARTSTAVARSRRRRPRRRRRAPAKERGTRLRC